MYRIQASGGAEGKGKDQWADVAAGEVLGRNIRKDFTVRKVKCWRRLLRETVETGDAQRLTRQDSEQHYLT